MTGSEHIVAIIVAGGGGSRAGAGAPKQFRLVGGRALLAHAYRAFVDHPLIDDVIVVVAPGMEEEARAAVGTEVATVNGGATRRESVAHGLAAATARRATRVLIHDAARPFVPARVIVEVVVALDEHQGALPALPVADTLARSETLRDTRVLGDIVARDGLWRVQTPQGFRLDAILAAHAAWPLGEEATDDAQMVRRLGGAVALVQGDPVLDKVTYPSDFALAEARAGAAWRTRMATGFDVHRLEDGEELWLGGVHIPHARGLSGHSDADVALHALTDALLGTIAAGDIGTHFPPSDPQWRGAESGQFLRHAAALIRGRGGEIEFVDLTIICEAPKIGPHRAVMTARIAELLEIPADRVSVKATTTEKLGFTGRGEGIAAQAAATVRLPT
ncbi:MAG TPA: bifunctional 2-C-methyl-D-erythritol 4-phosphate cytidylyltransferase/2-C-methyl-D-erythritol 2,4-cyclodiphosphate synthase [Sphingomonas sp.]|jgi:2-C-methyl-D-erythritol 4-phosphate cytidylyltransferase/2-C-methyl-D-erythritol 2,4-cyclodiphosphate synthase|uniref:bifunctional 2-C-methyl-D-erythritol 4-phosphate cytidylyltransferase/2-C-methyl-D-erythritol 2,4-cyclodiphosphate synthase n=1 Tax=Sphingomonas sp. TaxID=28214 RepID=UPI002ED949F5